MFGFLNRHELPEFSGLRDLTFANGFRGRHEQAGNLIGYVGIDFFAGTGCSSPGNGRTRSVDVDGLPYLQKFAAWP